MPAANPTPNCPPGSIAAIVPAAGSGQRFGSESNKLFATLAGKPLWQHAIGRLRDQPLIGRIIVPISEVDRNYFAVDHADTIQSLQVELIAGGDQRSDSVRSGLSALRDDDAVRWIAVHDAARPLVSSSDLAALFAVATETDAAILAAPITGTLRRELSLPCDEKRTETVDRRHLHTALTPQVFDADLLRRAYARHNGRPATDDAELVERIGVPVSLVKGSADNLKITYPEDLALAEALLALQVSPKE